MTLYQVRKKGNVRIVRLDEQIKDRCRSFGLYEQTMIYVGLVISNGYHILLCDDRIIAVPHWISRGIEI